MTVYWDSSAVIWYYGQGRIMEISGVTRPHALSEIFSALTGGGYEIVLPDGRKELWTTDQNDFEGLGKVPLKYLADIPAT